MSWSNIKQRAAVISTFHPDEAHLILLIEKIQSHVNIIFVVDDGTPSTIDFSRFKNVQLIQFEKNLGLAKALNTGIEQAMTSHEWILLFDQDSLPLEGYFQNIDNVLNSHSSEDTIYCPHIQYLKNEETVDGEYLSTVAVNQCITSGSIISKHCFQAIGLFREDFSIDYLDYEFALRARVKGFKINKIPSARLFHTLGKMRKYQIGPIHFYSSNHNEDRIFTRFRNRVVCYKKYFRFDPKWVMFDSYSALKEIVKISVAEENSSKKLRHAIKGVKAGMFFK